MEPKKSGMWKMLLNPDWINFAGMDFKNTNITSSKSPAAQDRGCSPVTSVPLAGSPGMTKAFSAATWVWGQMCSRFQGNTAGRVLFVPHSKGSGEVILTRKFANLGRQCGNSSFVQTHTLHAGAGRLCGLEQAVSICCVHSSMLVREERTRGRALSWQSEDDSWDLPDVDRKKCRIKIDSAFCFYEFACSRYLVWNHTAFGLFCLPYFT